MNKSNKTSEEKQPEIQPIDKYGFAEAPASVTVKIKSPANFEYMFTMRDEKASGLMFKIEAMEKKWLSLGYTPVVPPVRGGFPQKQIDYVPNRVCPTDGARLVKSTTKDGRKLIKCENNKWNFHLKRAEGCPFTEWEQVAQPNPIPTRQVDEYGDY